MRTTPLHLRRPTHLRFALPLIVVALAAGACGDDDDDSTAAAAADGPESAYCDTARAWAVHELDDNGGDPASVRTWFGEYEQHNATSLELSPESIRPQYVVNNEAITTILEPILEKYDFDIERIATEGTPEEQVIDDPPPDVEAAQAAIHDYDSRVCGAYQGAAADVVFRGDEPHDEFCAAVAEFDAAVGAVTESGYEPTALRELVESPEYDASLEHQAALAPPEIAPDVAPLAEWLRTQMPEVLEAYDYDIRTLLVEGTPEDRAKLNQTDPAIDEHQRRVLAYEEQICSS